MEQICQEIDFLLLLLLDYYRVQCLQKANIPGGLVSVNQNTKQNKTKKMKKQIKKTMKKSVFVSVSVFFFSVYVCNICVYILKQTRLTISNSFLRSAFDVLKNVFKRQRIQKFIHRDYIDCCTMYKCSIKKNICIIIYNKKKYHH